MQRAASGSELFQANAYAVRPITLEYSNGKVLRSTRLFLTMKIRIASNNDAKSIRVINDHFAELTRGNLAQGNPASDLLIYVGKL